MSAPRFGAAAEYPDDNRMFEAITSQLTDLDAIADLDTAPAGPADTTAPPAPAIETPAAPTPLSAPVPAPHQERTAVPTPAPPAPAPPAPAPPAPAPPAPAPPAPAPPAPVAVAAPPPRPRRPAPPAEPNYWGRHALVVVYWIAILTGAIGQVIFFGELFNLGGWGYVAAAVIATTAETVMVSSGDTGLHKRAIGRPTTQWLPFLLFAFIAATAAAGMNLSHWWSKNISMAVIFGGIAFLGFLLHIVHGFGDGTEYLAQHRKYEQAVAAREAEERAEFERARRAEENQLRQQQADKPAPAAPPVQGHVAAQLAAAPPKPRPAQPKKPASTKEARTVHKDKVSKEEVLAWALRQDAPPNATDVLRHFEQTGRELPTDRAVRGWLAEIKQS